MSKKATGNAAPVSAKKQIELHGHPVTYREMGEGPPLVLIHGITSSSRTWRSVTPALAEHYTVIAPDLLGHGQSAKPRGDYSLGAYASGVRDLLVALDVPRATVVGHSLGGGIAMQFAYQFPERVERLVLVDSGGLGSEVNIVLRAATLPGSEYVIPLLSAPFLRDAADTAGRFLDRIGFAPSADMRGMGEGLFSLGAHDARHAFLQTARSVIDQSGQKVDARDRLYLTEEVPSLIVWGERDHVIPVAHGIRAHELMPGSRLELFPAGGHFPFNDDPHRFVEVLHDFISTTEAATLDEEHVRGLLNNRARTREPVAA
jgi:pimeloyl-ACP methyl ester carboxylesterase